MKIINLTFILALFILLFSGCGKDDNNSNNEEEYVPVTDITLNLSSATISVDGKVQLIATIVPEDATNQNISWTSSGVATVDEIGLVIGRAEGTATITVTAEDGNLSASCTITVAIHPSEPQMVSVEGGTFTFGCTDDEDYYFWEFPTQQVTLSEFKIGKFLVMQSQWEAVMGDNPSRFIGENLPVERVSWDDVQEFIHKLNGLTGKEYRLPTEAEWEYAAREGSQSGNYKYSGSNNLDDVAWYEENSEDKTHPVGTKSPNKLGVFDMSGNVYEWCNDWYGHYTRDSKINPTGPEEGESRVLRGGAWRGADRTCRISYRISSAPDSFASYVGFRLVLP
ncbi:MAG: SUMF1/EgtB/PvdO family nonheme iron enzyme [Marinilabiliaceae bacterium]|nr:SUMF1/EgtB/PvdO family nonheme iron enzyme [Marinilabiliaceae bacterium]